MACSQLTVIIIKINVKKLISL